MARRRSRRDKPLPPPDQDILAGQVRPSEDGKVDQHPVHDDDQEDLEPEDYEEMTDAAAQSGLLDEEGEEE